MQWRRRRKDLLGDFNTRLQKRKGDSAILTPCRSGCARYPRGFDFDLDFYAKFESTETSRQHFNVALTANENKRVCISSKDPAKPTEFSVWFKHHGPLHFAADHPSDVLRELALQKEFRIDSCDHHDGDLTHWCEPSVHCDVDARDRETAAKTAAAFERHSASSLCGSLSATMPAPACTLA